MVDHQVQLVILDLQVQPDQPDQRVPLDQPVLLDQRELLDQRVLLDQQV